MKGMMMTTMTNRMTRTLTWVQGVRMMTTTMMMMTVMTPTPTPPKSEKLTERSPPPIRRSTRTRVTKSTRRRETKRKRSTRTRAIKKVRRTKRKRVQGLRGEDTPTRVHIFDNNFFKKKV
eukprot:PhF_6_TR6922/c0_g1_i2/m.10099